MCVNMGMFVNPDNLAFQAALNARNYVDKSGIQKKPRKSERQNDDYPYKELASQHDMDVF